MVNSDTLFYFVTQFVDVGFNSSTLTLELVRTIINSNEKGKCSEFYVMLRLKDNFDLKIFLFSFLKAKIVKSWRTLETFKTFECGKNTKGNRLFFFF